MQAKGGGRHPILRWGGSQVVMHAKPVGAGRGSGRCRGTRLPLCAVEPAFHLPRPPPPPGNHPLAPPLTTTVPR